MKFLEDYQEGERVSVYLKTRGRGAPGGWVEEVIHGTIVEVYTYEKKALVKLDIYSFRKYHQVRYDQMRSHEFSHSIQHSL